MRIVIDMQGAQTESRFRGIGRYTLSLTKAIIRNKGQHEIILVLNGLFPDTIDPLRAAFNQVLPQENIRVWYAPGPVYEHEHGNTWRHDVAEKVREFFIFSLNPDAVLISSLFEGYADNSVTSVGPFDRQNCLLNTFVILYDLIPLVNREFYLKPIPAYEAYYLRKIEFLKRATGCLAISEFSAQEAKKHLNIKDDKIINISTACDSIFHKINIGDDLKSNFLQAFGIKYPFVMYTGGSDDRKNLPNLIKSYAKLPLDIRKKLQLVMVGKISEYDTYELKKIAKSTGISDQMLIFTGYVTDNDLVMFYNLCEVFVFPSRYEGFGLPVLEAMSCGAVVIGANTTSIPEVVNCEDSLFDPLDIKSMSEKLLQVLTNDKLRTKLVKHGIEQAQQFSWDKSAILALKRIEDLSIHNFSITREGQKDILPELIKTISAFIPVGISNKEIMDIANMLVLFDKNKVIKQFFVDISELVKQDNKTGVQRVTRSILKELLENPPVGYVVEPVYATMGKSGYYYARSFIDKFLGQINNEKDEPIIYSAGDVFLGLELQHDTVINNRDYLIKLNNEGVEIYFIVYDLLSILMPRLFNHQLSIIHEAWLKTIVNFNGVICISRTVADEMVEWCRNNFFINNPKFKINSFHLGADVDSSVPSKGLPDNANDVIRELRKNPTFLTVGTIEPRKGQDQILSAFELLWKEGKKLNLVIVGKQGWLVEALVKRLRDHSRLNKNLFWLDGISDEYLDKIYSLSTCLVAASEGEGFGLPLIEAAKHKLPIIARDIPVFREVTAGQAFYFSGFEPEDLSKAVNAWIKLNRKGLAPQSINIPWQTWRESNQQLLKNILSSNVDSSNLINLDSDIRRKEDGKIIKKILRKVIVVIICSRFKKPLKKIYYLFRLNKLDFIYKLIK